MLPEQTKCCNQRLNAAISVKILISATLSIVKIDAEKLCVLRDPSPWFTVLTHFTMSLCHFHFRHLLCWEVEIVFKNFITQVFKLSALKSSFLSFNFLIFILLYFLFYSFYFSLLHGPCWPWTQKSPCFWLHSAGVKASTTTTWLLFLMKIDCRTLNI